MKYCVDVYRVSGCLEEDVEADTNDEALKKALLQAKSSPARVVGNTDCIFIAVIPEKEEIEDEEVGLNNKFDDVVVMRSFKEE